MHSRNEVSNDELVQRLLKLLTHHENKCCADCGQRNPRWVAWNHGVFICMRCAGLHRNLGVQVSKVKSVTLDRWTEEQVVFLEGTSNEKKNKIFEGKLDKSVFVRPVSDNDAKEFIRKKYKEFLFRVDENIVVNKEKKAENKESDLLLDIFSEPLKPAFSAPNGVFDVFSEVNTTDNNNNKNKFDADLENIMGLYKNN